MRTFQCEIACCVTLEDLQDTAQAAVESHTTLRVANRSVDPEALEAYDGRGQRQQALLCVFQAENQAAVVGGVKARRETEDPSLLAAKNVFVLADDDQRSAWRW